MTVLDDPEPSGRYWWGCHADRHAGQQEARHSAQHWQVSGKTLDVEFEQPFLEALERAVTPSDADVIVARGVVLDLLAASDEPVLLTAFEDAWLTALGSRRPAEQAVTSADDPNRRYADPDPRDVHLMEFRARHSVRRAVAQLIGEAFIAQGEGNQYPIQPTRISVTYPGGGSSAPVVVNSPAIGDESSTPRFLPIRPIRARQDDVLLPAEEMLAGLDAVLGRRAWTWCERAAGPCTGTAGFGGRRGVAGPDAALARSNR